jgi:hypothetical protein
MYWTEEEEGEFPDADKTDEDTFLIADLLYARMSLDIIMDSHVNKK